MVCRIFLAVLLGLIPVSSFAGQGRFFYEGNGSLSITNENTKKGATVQYRLADGTYNLQAIHQLDNVFGMPSGSLKEDISLRLISVLDYLEDHFSKGQTLSLLSGFRTKEHNRHLRRSVKTSYHLDGMAADVIFPGVPSKQVWEYVRTLDCCGAGYYFGKAVHIDSGKPRFWTAVSRGRPKEHLENHYVYLAPDKDIYRAGETMRLFLSAVSDYPFGIRPVFHALHKKRTLLSFKPLFHGEKNKTDCQSIRSREEARFITWDIPADLTRPNSPLNIKIRFCGNPWPVMPKSILSKPFVITPVRDSL